MFQTIGQRSAISLAVAGCFAVVLGGCGGGDSNDSIVAATPVETACADLATKFTQAGVRITTAKVVDATTNLVGTGPSGTTENTGPLPAHCLVQGVANERTGTNNKPYAIGFEVRMPQTKWNGRFFFQGGGGANGFLATAYGNLRGNIVDANGIPADNALSRGFAVAATDGGHLAASGTDANNQTVFGEDPQARLDYGYNAVARTTEIAKALIAKRYGTTANKSYFVGCSNGGRDAMVASQRLPNEFDGVFALNPGFQLPKAAVNQAWDTQQFASLSSKIYDSFSQADLNYVSSQILSKCDALDGARDGLIQDQEACSTAFAPATDLATCTGANDGTCLSAAQKTVLANVFGGVKDASGNSFYSDFPWDAGINYKDWRSWKIGRKDVAASGAATGASQAISIGAFSLPAVFTQPSTLITGDSVLTGSSNALAFMQSVKTLFNPTGTVDPESIYATSGIYTTPAMSKTRGEGFMSGNSIKYDTFKARGAKLIVAHGTSDGVFSSNDTKSWYKTLDTAYGGKAGEFAKFFPIPGMNHCSGGSATDKFDMVTALVNWVEKGEAPTAVSASSRDQNYLYTTVNGWASYKPTLIAAGINRPLCAYPTVARSTDGGTTWTCK